MPILQEVNDPYYASTGSALAGMVNTDPAGTAAQAQALAERMRLANMQQQKLSQEMLAERQKQQWEVEDRKKLQNAEDAAGRYWGVQPVAPVGGDRAAMEKFYREQNYYDQMARLAARTGKGSDIPKAMGEMQTNFNTAHPAPIGGGGSLNMPPEIAANPEAAKKFAQEKAKQVADQQVADADSKRAAARYLPEMLRARQHYSDASGYIGQIQGNEWLQAPENIIGKLPGAGGLAQGVAKRAALEKEMAAFQGPQIAANNKGLGPMTNYEQQLARLPFAKVNDVNAQVGLDAFDGQLAHTLTTLGYNVPPRHITMLLNGIREGNQQVLSDFQAKYGPEALNLIAGALK